MNNREEGLLREYMKLPYTVTLKRDEDEDVIAEVRDLEGCTAHGQSDREALTNLEEVKLLWLTAAIKAGQNVPRPEIEDQALPSGKFIARVPRTLHKRLVELAKREGVSLNQVVAVGLAEAVSRKEQAFHYVHTKEKHLHPGSYGAYGGACAHSKVRMISGPNPVFIYDGEGTKNFLAGLGVGHFTSSQEAPHASYAVLRQATTEDWRQTAEKELAVG